MWCRTGGDTSSDWPRAISTVRCVRRSAGGGGETYTVKLTVDLGGDVGPGERGPGVGHLAGGDPCDVGQDVVGQIARAQERQVVASGRVATHDSG